MRPRIPMAKCPVHRKTLVCPVCIASKGGRTTARRYSRRQQVKWGKRGGRPRKAG